MKYSAEFIEHALGKALGRGDRTIASVADELNVKFETLKKWLNRYSSRRSDVVSKEKRPHEWGRDEQFAALLETHSFNEEQLNAWCRERGLFPHHLEEWRAAFCAPDAGGEKFKSDKALRHENAELKKELKRKDKALAETAALLVLQKKLKALWEDEDE